MTDNLKLRSSYIVRTKASVTPFPYVSPLLQSAKKESVRRNKGTTFFLNYTICTKEINKHSTFTQEICAIEESILKRRRNYNPNRPSEYYTLMSDREYQIGQICNHLFGGANINEIYLHIQNNPKRFFRHKNTPIQSVSGMPREEMTLSSGRPKREFPVLSGRSSGGPRCVLPTKMKNKSGVSNRQKQPSQNILRTSTLHCTLFPKAKKKSVFLKITCNGNAPFIPYIRQVTTEEERKNLTLQRKRQDGMLTSERMRQKKVGSKLICLPPILVSNILICSNYFSDTTTRRL